MSPGEGSPQDVGVQVMVMGSPQLGVVHTKIIGRDSLLYGEFRELQAANKQVRDAAAVRDLSNASFPLGVKSRHGRRCDCNG